MKTLPVHEMFYTFQGEGVYMGQPAFFIRLFGCPVQCPWCDSAGTWHPEYIPKDIKRMTATEILEAVVAANSKCFRIVITGGEPTIHDLNELTKFIEFDFHLETSGAFPLKGNFDWITLSPKRWKLPLACNISQANEFKIIVEKPEDIEFYLDILGPGLEEVPVWLHPEWSQHKNPEVLRAIAEAVKASVGVRDLRAGWQLHKLYSVDLLDKGSRPTVPLGGNPKLGY